ncbi:MAG: protein phosphatase 2C domain-containing protein [Firmicutes bacterium]|nr:protein phosphatase 2C domain-containing protein [Bacillota bacterium]MCM1401249.1 protein phosphatase 2C domain-containing protein [Bacteroides sp.]MCM1477202.1 protein phosphatase 2C domain-containing protein [Bacteroides sp.]
MNTENVTVSFFGAIDTGRKRSNNEDNYIACELWGGTHILLAAIDGIGGYEGGEVAAQIARDVITAEVSSRSGVDCLELLKHAVTKANNAIVEHKRKDAARSRMGCVISSAIISVDERRLYMVHVGDSRLYQFTAVDGLKKLSHDHSLVGYREEVGLLTEEQAMTHPQRNIIERSLGDELHNPDDPNFLDAGIFPILGPTQFLLCSDGLSDMLYSRQIASVLVTDAPAQDEVRKLIDMANDAGGKDNITAVIAKVNVPAITQVPLADEVDDITFGPELPPADNSDDMIAIPEPQPLRQATSEEAVKPKKSLATKLNTKRVSVYVITIAISFLVGGTAGFFIGRLSTSIGEDKEPDAPVEETIVTPMDTTTTDTIYNPELVGPEVADSLNKKASGKVTSAEATAPTSTSAQSKPATDTSVHE